MRLLFVLDSLRAAGAQRQMVNVASVLRGRGHAVDFFVYHPELAALRPELEEVGIEVHAYRKRLRLDPGVIFALARRVRAGDYDGVLSFLTAPNLYAEIARPSRPRPVLVVSERNDLDPATPRIAAALVRRMHAWRSDAVVTNSEAQRARIESTAPALRPKTRTIPNGVDLARFHPADAKTAPAGMVAVGAVSPRKNAPALVRALALTREARGDCPRLSWAGETGGPAFDAADRLVAELGLRDRWSWLGSRTDVPELLRGAEALIHPSLREGHSNAICEALASGIPVLAASRFDHPQLLGEDAERGLLFDPEDPADIARAIARFLDLRPDARRQMGRRARSFAEATLSLERAAEAYEALFEALLERAP